MKFHYHILQQYIQNLHLPLQKKKDLYFLLYNILDYFHFQISLKVLYLELLLYLLQIFLFQQTHFYFLTQFHHIKMDKNDFHHLFFHVQTNIQSQVFYLYQYKKQKKFCTCLYLLDVADIHPHKLLKIQIVLFL